MRQIDQEIIEATDELKSDVALTTEIITGNENTEVEVAPGNTVRSPKKMIEDCYRETQQAIEQQFGSLDKAVDDATSAANRADSASQSSSGSAGDSAASSAAAKNSADTATEQATAAAASASAARESEQAALQFSEQTSADASATADHEASAATWGERAEQQAKAAAQSSTTASSQATMAKAWAANPEDARVDGERYSSLHYASKSSEYADASSGNAELSRDQSMLAQQAMRNASNSEINANLSKVQAQQAATEAGQSKEASGVSEQKAADSAAAAKNSETTAVGAADSALDSKNSAAGSAGTATQQADRSESEADRSEAAADGLTAISNPNLLINGDFSVWQRGANYVNWTRGYTADRWNVSNFTPEAYSWIGVDGIFGATPYLDGSNKYCLNHIRITHADANLPLKTYIRQVIEKADVLLSNTQVTASVYVYAASVAGNPKLRIDLRSQDDPYEISLKAGWHKYIYTHTTDDFTKKTQDHFGGGSPWFDIYLIEDAGYSTIFALSEAKLELGPVATPFIPDDPATNLAKCQRYYIKNLFNGTRMDQDGYRGTWSLLNIDFPSSMRSVPTLILYGNSLAVNSTIYLATNGITLRAHRSSSGGGVTGYEANAEI